MRVRRFAAAAAAAALVVVGVTTGAVAQQKTWKMPVLQMEPPFDWNGKLVPATWESLDPKKVTKKWHVCVLFPHVKDPIYLAYSYGAVEQAKALGIKLTVVE